MTALAIANAAIAVAYVALAANALSKQRRLAGIIYALLACLFAFVAGSFFMSALAH